MKQLFLSLFLCTLFGSAAQAATVSGTVTSVATCAPVAGQKVYLRDSMFAYIDSAVTNSSGFYTINFPSAWPNPNSFLITIVACGNLSNNTSVYTGGNATVNAIICGSVKYFHGTVKLGGSGLPDNGATKVYLVKIQRNFPVAGDTTLTAVDSNVLTNGTYSFVRACAPTDTFLVKAMLLPAHPSYANYLPTYDSSLTWSSATRFPGSAFSPIANPHNIYLMAGTNPGGPGFVGGSVLVGANKQAAVGDPLAKRLLILTNSATNAPVAYTYSDATGNFSFSNIAVGTYKLFGDAWGLYNLPLTVSVTAAKPTVNNIIFEENYGENTFKGRFSTTGVGNTAALAGVSAYPNPATSFVSLTGMNQIKGSKTLVLRDIVGATVASKTFAEGQTVELATANLPSGTYLLQVSTEVGLASFQIVK